MMDIIDVNIIFVREDGTRNFVRLTDNPKLVTSSGPMTFNETMVIARAADMVNDYVEFEKKRRDSLVNSIESTDTPDEVKH